MYLLVSVDPDRCWLPYGVGPPVLPFLTCEKKRKQGWRWEREMERWRKGEKQRCVDKQEIDGDEGEKERGDRRKRYFFIDGRKKKWLKEPVRAASDQLGSSQIIPSTLHASTGV